MRRPTTATTLPPPAPGPSAASWRLWARNRSLSATKTLESKVFIFSLSFLLFDQTLRGLETLPPSQPTCFPKGPGPCTSQPPLYNLETVQIQLNVSRPTLWLSLCWLEYSTQDVTSVQAQEQQEPAVDKNQRFHLAKGLEISPSMWCWSACPQGGLCTQALS